MNFLAVWAWMGVVVEVIDLFAKKHRRIELNYKQ
jgi:hypothetical protein